MPHIPHCKYNAFALKTALRSDRPDTAERLVGWAAAAPEPDAMRQTMLIATSLLPGIGDLAALLFHQRSRILLLLTDHRLLCCSVTDPGIGPVPGSAPISISLGDLEVGQLDDAHGFSIAEIDEAGTAIFKRRLKLDEDAKPDSPADRLRAGLIALADDPLSNPSTDPPLNPDDPDWQPKPSRWT